MRKYVALQIVGPFLIASIVCQLDSQSMNKALYGIRSRVSGTGPYTCITAMQCSHHSRKFRQARAKSLSGKTAKCKLQSQTRYHQL